MNPKAIQARCDRLLRECQASPVPALLLLAACAALLLALLADVLPPLR